MTLETDADIGEPHAEVARLHGVEPQPHQPKRKAIAVGQLLINGKWVDATAGETMAVTDPTTEATITHVQKAGVVDAERAIDAAYEAFENGPWGKMRHEDRAKILFKMADLMDERADDFAIREAMDMGMPYRDFRTIIMPHCSGLFRFFAGQAMAHMDGGYRTSYEPNIRILTRREPLGVVAAITPWNFPLALTCSKIAPGLAAGNVVIHKPASDTPLTALALAQVALDAGVPEGVYNMVTGGGGTIGDTFVKSVKVDKIAFTGSTSVGQGIIRNGAETIKHQTMELIHHSDRGSQYAAGAYVDQLAAIGAVASMSRTACGSRPRAHGELLPNAQGRARPSAPLGNPRRGPRDLFAYVEGYYNRARIHSAIGYLTPEQAERKAS